MNVCVSFSFATGLTETLTILTSFINADHQLQINSLVFFVGYRSCALFDACRLSGEYIDSDYLGEWMANRVGLGLLWIAELPS